MSPRATINDKAEDAKSGITAQYVGRSMAKGDAEQVEAAFRLFAAQAQRLKDAERLRKMIPGDQI